MQIEERTQVWSYGGGTQTAAIAVLIKEGILVRPDIACIADTSREMPSTWDYLHNVIQPYLEDTGVVIRIIPHEFSRVDLYSSGRLAIPAYTATGRFPTYCSGEWKRDAIQRWLRAEGVKQCDTWIGFSIDEQHRCSQPRRKWVRHTYPLIDCGINKRMCIRIIEKAGLPLPSKSRCWCCPHQNRDEWREVLTNETLRAKATELDEQIREADSENALYLHSSRVPLSMVDANEPVEVLPLFQQGCKDAGCFT